MLAQFALGIWCIISVDLVSGSLCSGRLGVAEEFGKFDFTGDVSFCGCNAWFDSGYILCESTLVASDVFHTFSTLRRTRILRLSFSIRLEWRSCPADASGCCLTLRTWHLKTWKSLFYELHVAAMRDQGQDFLGHLCQSQVLRCRSKP